MKVRLVAACVVVSLVGVTQGLPGGGTGTAEAAAPLAAGAGTEDVPDVPAQPLPQLADPVDAADSVDALPAQEDLPADTVVSVTPGLGWTRVADLPVKLTDASPTTTASEAAPISLTWEVPEGHGRGLVLIGLGAGVGDGSLAPGDGVLGDGVRVRLSYGGFDRAFGGGWVDRMRVVAYPACFAHGSPSASCTQGVPVEVTRDPATRTLTWDAAEPTADPAVTGLAARDPVSDAGGVVFAVGGAAGSYAATPLPASTGWQVSEGSGEFAYSYPFEMPTSVGGATPDLTLSYSSGSVDAMSRSENGQASPAGIGWTMAPGYVSRRYAACVDDGLPDKGDLCWKTTGGKLVDQLTLVLGDRSSRLVPVAGAPDEFRLQDDPTWRVQRVRGSGTSVSNTDNDNEAFKVTTTDGTVYWFGNGNGTSSTWTVPVFGNDAGEPCYSPTTGDAWCQQAWQWNLDRVIDPSGNRIEYGYTRETNHYSRYAVMLAGGNRTAYDRGGVLASVAYGFGDGVAHQRAEVGVRQRCLGQLTDPAASCTGDDGPRAKPAQWPDVPAALICDANDLLCVNVSPSFFSTLRYASVATKTVAGGPDTSVARVVDSYDLEHTMPDPDGAGPDDPDLWLNQVTRYGGPTGAQDRLPPVQFNGGNALQNRVVAEAGERTLKKFRIRSVRNETGGRIDVVYGHADQMHGNDQEDRTCTPAYVTGLARHASVRECFPQWYLPAGGGAGGFEWFHKYVVTRIALGDDALGYRLGETQANPSALGSLRVFDYEYRGSPAWRYAPSPNVEDGKQTWNDWRGYEKTVIHTRNVLDNTPKTDDRSARRVTVYRGMNLSRIDTPGSGQDHVVRLSTEEKADADEPLDHLWLQGRVAEEKQFKGQVLRRAYHEYDSYVTASNPDLVDARIVFEKLTRHHHEDLPLIDDRVSEVAYAVHDGGPETRGQRLGLLAGVVTSVERQGWTPGDKRCTATTWTSADGPWIRVPETITTSSGSCGGAPTDEQVDAKTRYFYDDGESDPAAPLYRGLVTQVRTHTGPGDSAGAFIDTRTNYDPRGRVTGQRDGNRNWTTTTYNPGGDADDLTTSLRVTDPQGFTTDTTLDNRRGQPVVVTDANDKTTLLSYDGLGRLTTVRRPGNADPTPPSMQFLYEDSTGQPSRVTTLTLRAGSTRDTSHDFYDGWGRQIESQVRQADTTGTERVTTATGYNEQGLAYLHIPAAPTGSGFGTLLNADPATVSHYTLTAHDGGGRLIWVADKSMGTTVAETEMAVHGDREYSYHPVGGATASRFDAWGRVVEVQQFDDTFETTPAHRASYSYDAVDRLVGISAPVAGQTAEWAYGYDWAGRRLTALDPDTGTTTTQYDDNGNPTRVTDATGAVVTTTYDKLNRPLVKSGAQPGGTAATMATWTYDAGIPNARGRLVLSSTNTPLGTFTESVTGYDNRGNPQATAISYPGTLTGEGTGPVTKTTNLSYNELDQVTSASYPAVPGVLDTLTLDTRYTDNGLFKSITQGSAATIGSAGYNNINLITSLDSTAGGSSLERTYTRYADTARLATLQASVDSNVLLDLHYHYDQRGNPTKVTADGRTSLGQPSSQAAWCYTYDGLDRLASAQAGMSTSATPNGCDLTPSALNAMTPYRIRYGYQHDRLTTAHGQAIGAAAAWDARWVYQTGTHRTTSLDNPDETVNNGTFSYDSAGRVLSRFKATPQTEMRYSYAPDGTLIRNVVQNQLGPDTTHAYAADGTRIAREVVEPATPTNPNTPTTTTLFLGPTEVTRTVSRDGSGTVVSDTTTAIRRTTTPDGTPLATLQSTGSGTAGNWTWLFADAQGSLRSTNGPTGQTYTAYQPFGQPIQQPLATPGRRGYLDKPHDPDGSIRLDHRPYEPDTWILTTPDPIFRPHDPQTLNPYAYARNNPIKLSDPSGLEPNVALAPGYVGPVGFDRPKNPQGNYDPATSDPNYDPDRYYYNNPAKAGSGYDLEPRSFLAALAGFAVSIGASAGCAAAVAPTVVGVIGCGAVGGAAGSATVVALDGRDQTIGQAASAVATGTILGGITAGLLRGTAPLRVGAAKSVDEAGALVRYDPMAASRNILGQVGEGYARTPGGRTISAHAAERIAYGAPGRSPTTLAQVDDILNNPTRFVYRSSNDTVRVYQGKDWVVVSGTGPQHIVTVMIR